MAQEKFTDQKLKEVVKNQQKAMRDHPLEDDKMQEFNQTLQQMV